ncbi:gluconokinase [uncultured Cellulomonas sp.]|uniref:gluconokinase n=1 Tax=uncultured Cellulomonas sp. TaxID=189682 RepID=UPI002622E48E|nr:gluconokinase [uncultured Cellulomonas sp.]
MTAVRPPHARPAEPARRPHRVIIGVDVGTTAAKVVAFGVDTLWRHVAVREYPLLEPVAGQAVQDPDVVVEAMLAALSDCVAASAGTEVIGVSVSAAMHGLVGLDAALRPLTPLVTWADGRAIDVSRGLRAAGLAAELHAATGTPVHPMSPLTKLVWFARHEPAVWTATRWWVGLKDLVLHRLTGELVTELSSASATGLMDLRSRGWSPAAVDLSGARPDQLPPILPTTAVRGLAPDVASRVGLPAGTPVVLGAADGPLGNLGTGAMSPGVVGMSLGTSGAVRTIVEAPPAALHPALFCYALTESAWAVGGAVSNGGIVVRWAGESLAPDLDGVPGGATADERLLDLAASVPPGSDGLLMLPYLLPERAPLWDPDLSGALWGLRRRHTRAHVVRAAVEGVALQLASIVDTIDAVVPVTSVRATGGALRSPVWRHVLAAVLGRPLVVAGAAEGSALGAAALGLHALGHAPVLAEATAMLCGPAAHATDSVPTDRDAAAVYTRTRAVLPELLRAMATTDAILAGR